MRGYWLASYLLLWALALGLVAVVVALARQIGVLHLRLAPTGALDVHEGPLVGDPAPAFDGLRPGRESLLVFGSETCGMCRDLLPSVTALARAEPAVTVAVVSASAEFSSLAKVPAIGIADTAVVAAFRVRSTPFAVYMDVDGVVRAKGIVNTMEHLESVLERGRQVEEHI